MPVLSVSGVSTWNWSLDEDLRFYERAGIDAVGLSWRKVAGSASIEGALARLAAAGVRVANIIEVGPEPPVAVWEVARELDAPVIVTSGAPAGRTWEECARDFAARWREHRPDGVRVALEHTNPFRVDLSFVHRLRDAVDLARDAGIGVCMEVQACWSERALASTIADAVDGNDLLVVQLSDFVIGTKCTPDRAVPGDGHIPLDRILGNLADSGYRGDFDIELVGPRIEAEGYEGAVTRSLQSVSALLRAAGLPTR